MSRTEDVFVQAIEVLLLQQELTRSLLKVPEDIYHQAAVEDAERLLDGS